MKLLKIILREFLVLGLLFGISWAAAVMGLRIISKEVLDMKVDGTYLRYGAKELGLLVFIALTTFIYSVRYVLFKRAHTLVGIIGLSYVVVSLLVIQQLSPQYVQARLLMGADIEIEPVQVEYTEEGWPIFPDDYMNQIQQKMEEAESKIRQELLWIQIPLMAAGLWIIILLIYLNLNKKNTLADVNKTT